MAGTIALLKCRNEKTGKVDLERFLPGLRDADDKATSGGWKLTVKAIWSLMGVGQENLLTFLLFWIGFYVSVRSALIWLKVLVTDSECSPDYRLLFMVRIPWPLH